MTVRITKKDLVRLSAKYSYKEIAKRLGCSVGTIRNYVTLFEIPHVNRAGRPKKFNICEDDETTVIAETLANTAIVTNNEGTQV